MNDLTKILAGAIAIGAGATAVMDLWALLQRQLLGIPALDYRLVGRWLGHLTKGRLAHEAIGRASPVAGEAALGWAAHYAIGIAFAGVLLAVAGVGWMTRPTLAPALIVGVGSILAPFLIMQPAFGFGIAASKTPSPWGARLRSLITHTVFALGLYLSGLAMAAVLRG
ncbi:DUF2938 domain-containing protein [Bradyrhizobium sp. 2TAF24]|uniref:DUF2938 domain-containing protein n=1 Tax=Bradyrhizobium sp. 2TAF24 TaxID=3233011 RepID=UPI003F8E9EB3